ncbi:death-on-curing protein [Candidatus Nomurabacteria bacterium CG_4_9_14_0_2_um_filter_32_10]|uniref:Death-on-curing protein n=1 Tax=Candidatus Nomurabacteria bacterium CG_4_9_14_0_2_um_filter_32_10 TaxID=1974729 RepID=A0A2J0N514_9BACT|nr:MAG: death-on-curing protein [Candidatus Nomurabacteria bacterium CG_4_9_14_0_2_um_filter_32_10]
MKKLKNKNNIVIYQAKNGAIELRGDFQQETVWATQAQIAQLFEVTSQNVTLHLNNIFKDKELDIKTTCKESLQVQIEGKRKVERTIKFYNLDAIIAVGYRISSIMGTNFRIWATKTLREHITKGYTINKKQITKNYDAFIKSVGDIQALLPEHITLDPKSVLELIKEFASTWVSLDAYDKEILVPIGITKKAIKLSGLELTEAIMNLRSQLIKKGEAKDIFAQEREDGSIRGIVGNVMQSFGGKDLYLTAEEKAAHLLYFMVKNHPFVDGNKRAGAFAFVWFLRKTKIKTMRNINPNALTALTLFIAESNPNKKEQMVALITQMLK